MMIARLMGTLLLASLLAAPTPAPPWKGLPLRTMTKDHGGKNGDVTNLAFEGAQATIIAAFKKIGWVQADPLSAVNDAHLAAAAVAHQPYPTAPVSTLYLFGRMQDFAMEHEVGSVSKRDHARFWDTKRQDPRTHLELWLSDASRDIAIEPLMKDTVPVGTTHKIDPNIDAERGLIDAALNQARLVSAKVIEMGIPTTNGRNGSGDRFFTDGKVPVFVLSAPR